uniref:Coatomer beta subunit appendage platform domain-containing protein n=1 Tax=Aegilops tauschii subsp. strangulata TaxID=200361 RepID=A0A453ES37_AEGTS
MLCSVISSGSYVVHLNCHVAPLYCVYRFLVISYFSFLLHLYVSFYQVAVNTVIQDEKKFLNHVIKSTNMKCLTPPSALDGECGYIAANLYAKSVFGEDALVNISIEKQVDGKLSGYIRIRSKTQGIALSLGDKITLKQKGGS